jgi:predicted regulator of Ras-like GTPase activity (Roadblock/LC7/MglB family)
MQTVLSQLNSVPGVIGSLACDMEGRVLSHAFPSLFDTAMLEDAVRVIVDGAAGLDLASGSADQLEFRFADAHLFVKPFPGAILVVLSGKGINVQFVNLSVSLAAGKLAKLRLAPAPVLPTTAAGSLAQEPSRRPAQPPAQLPAQPPAQLPDGGGSASDDPRHAKRVARPTKGLDELRKRLAEKSRQESSGNVSITMPIDLPVGKKP